MWARRRFPSGCACDSLTKEKKKVFGCFHDKPGNWLLTRSHTSKIQDLATQCRKCFMSNDMQDQGQGRYTSIWTFLPFCNCMKRDPRKSYNLLLSTLFYPLILTMVVSVTLSLEVNCALAQKWDPTTKSDSLTVCLWVASIWQMVRHKWHMQGMKWWHM